MTAPTHPLRLRDFQRFCIARSCATLATSGMVIILGYQLYDVSRRDYDMSIARASFELGLLGLVQFLPLFLMIPVAGIVADRFDRRRVATCAFLADLLVAGALAFAAATHHASLPLLFTFAGLHGAAKAFINPALSAIPPNIVPAELLPTAIALGSMASQSGTIIGPAFAGLMFGLAAPAPYAVSALLLGTAAIAATSIRPVPPPAQDKRRHPLQQLADGFAYVIGQRFLLGCITLDLFAVLLGGATALLPVYARDILHVGAQGLGLMRGAPAAGAMLVALRLSTAPLAENVGVKMLWAVVVYGAATIVFGLSRWFPLSLALLAAYGAADMISVYIRTSLIQLRTPDDKRGRVSAISGLGISASNELGEMESGLAASLLGATGAVVFGGVAAIVITGIWAMLFPEIRRARRFVPLEPAGADLREGEL